RRARPGELRARTRTPPRTSPGPGSHLLGGMSRRRCRDIPPEETLREARAAGIEWLVALGTYWIAHGILLQGDPTSARAVYEEAREIWRSLGDQQGRGFASILSNYSG